jgi:hypothetical protein
MLIGLLESALVDESGVSLINIIPSWFSMLIYLLVRGVNNRPVNGRSSET